MDFFTEIKHVLSMRSGFSRTKQPATTIPQSPADKLTKLRIRSYSSSKLSRASLNVVYCITALFVFMVLIFHLSSSVCASCALARPSAKQKEWLNHKIIAVVDLTDQAYHNHVHKPSHAETIIAAKTEYNVAARLGIDAFMFKIDWPPTDTTRQFLESIQGSSFIHPFLFWIHFSTTMYLDDLPEFFNEYMRPNYISYEGKKAVFATNQTERDCVPSELLLETLDQNIFNVYSYKHSNNNSMIYISCTASQNLTSLEASVPTNKFVASTLSTEPMLYWLPIPSPESLQLSLISHPSNVLKYIIKALWAEDGSALPTVVVVNSYSNIQMWHKKCMSCWQEWLFSILKASLREIPAQIATTGAVNLLDAGVKDKAPPKAYHDLEAPTRPTGSQKVCILVRTYHKHGDGDYNLHKMLTTLQALHHTDWKAYVFPLDNITFLGLSDIVNSLDDDRIQHVDLPENVKKPYNPQTSNYDVTDWAINDLCVNNNATHFNWMLVTNGDNWYTPDTLNYLPSTAFDMVLMNFYTRHYAFLEAGLLAQQHCCHRLHKGQCRVAKPLVSFTDLGGMLINVDKYRATNFTFMGAYTKNGGCDGCQDGVAAQEMAATGWRITSHDAEVCALYHNENIQSCALMGGVWYDTNVRNAYGCFDIDSLPIPIQGETLMTFYTSEYPCVC